MRKPIVPPSGLSATRAASSQHNFTVPAQPLQPHRAKPPLQPHRAKPPRVGVNAPDMLKHTQSDQVAVVEAVHGKRGIQTVGNPPPNVKDNPFMQVSNQLKTGVPNTFSTRQLQKGEQIYARSDADRVPGQFSSPEKLGREVAVKGHALAWTGQQRHDQHSKMTTFEVTDSNKAGTVLSSIAAPQIHTLTREPLPGGRMQHFHAQGLSNPGDKGLKIVKEELDPL